MSVNVKLPDERGEQLRQIAKAKRITMVQVIEETIQREIDAGTIPADLPGVTVAKTRDGMTIELPGFGSEMSMSDAAKLADGLREVSSPLTHADRERKQRLLEGLGALSGIKVERMANGVKLVSPLSDRKYPLTFTVASDLADQIDRAAK